MDFFINTKTFQYTGDCPFKFKDCNFREIVLEKGDTITLENNHYARFLAQKIVLTNHTKVRKTQPKTP